MNGLNDSTLVGTVSMEEEVTPVEKGWPWLWKRDNHVPGTPRAASSRTSPEYCK